jgi:hypothetical protein
MMNLVSARAPWAWVQKHRMSQNSRNRNLNRFLRDPAYGVAEMKEQQASKIKEIGTALVAAGFRALDEQADVLELSRTTTWTILKGNQKSSGLSVVTLNRILAARRLPPIVRDKIHEYIREKAAGLYGDSEKRIRKIAALQSLTSTKHR